MLFSSNGGRSYGNVAITMDGSISANFVTTGTMSANRIRTGILQDENNNVNWNLSTGVLTIKKGSISLGISTSFPNGRFSVDDFGYLKAEYGEIAGFNIDSSSIYNSVMDLSSIGLKLKRDNINLGKFGTNSIKNHSGQRGLVIDLENEANYISWSYKENASDDFYTIKLIYTGNTTNGYVTDRVTIGCDLDLLDWTAYNFWMDPNSCGVDEGLTLENGDNVRISIVDRDNA